MAAQEAASQINWKNYPRLTIKFRFENLNSSLMTAYRTSSINTDDLPTTTTRDRSRSLN